MHLWGCWPPPHAPGPSACPAAPAGARSTPRLQVVRAGSRSRASPRGPRGGRQGEGAGLCAFLALPENGSKPRGRRMRSLTMAVPTEKAAIRQAMPRGRRARAAAAGTGGGREAALAPGWAAAPRAGSGSGCRWGSSAPPRRAGPAPAQPTQPRLAGARGGAEPAGARALVLLPRKCPLPARQVRRILPSPGAPPRPETRGGWISRPERPKDSGVSLQDRRPQARAAVCVVPAGASGKLEGEEAWSFLFFSRLPFFQVGT